MASVKKNIRQHSDMLPEGAFSELQTIVERYVACRNYICSRFSGINSIHLLSDHRKLIRDVWVKSGFAEQFHLPARYWKLALDEAIATIKSEWSNTKNRVRQAVMNNPNLNEEERHYIFFVLTWNSVLQSVLQRKPFEKPEGLAEIPVRNEKYIHNLICRYIRKYKGKIPYSKKERSFMADAPMYKYEIKNNQLTLLLAGLKKGKRIAIPLNDRNLHSGNIRIVLNKEYRTLEVHRCKDTEVTKVRDCKAAIGIDKGYTSLFAVSSDKECGTELGSMLSQETERLNEVNAKRNQIWAQIKKCEDNKEFEKAQRIRDNNFGKKKYDKQKARAEAEMSSYINHEIRNMIFTEKPSTIACEELTFNSWKKKLPKGIKRKLSRWCKGYIQKRLDYICSLYGINVEKVNPAYTSQVCHKCGRLGNRNGKTFTCEHCGNMDADINASHNVLARLNDDEITLSTPYNKVKEIVLSRVPKTVSPTTA